MIAALASPDRYAPDGRYAFVRLGLALLVSTITGAGMWAIIVVLPAVQAEFAVARAAASAPYTATMIGFAAGTILLGRLADRVGIAIPVVVAAVTTGGGFVLCAVAPDIGTVIAVHALLIGFGAGGGFAPLMADTSHWFVRQRGLAVVLVASGNYLAGTVWPLAIKAALPTLGWRGVYLAIGVIVAATVLPLAFFMRRRPSAEVFAAAEKASAVAKADVGLSSRALIVLLTTAGFSCCVAMSMPQVHIVAYCGDLGYGVARGAEMLALMLFLGIFSRVASGFVADRIGGAKTLLVGSFMQGVALLLYLFFDGLTSLFVVSGIFGLFQGGIVPMYAVISRELLPPREAGAKIGILVSATISGMAVGGYLSGLIFDWSGSYRLAFFNGLVWNWINLVIVGWLVWRVRKRPSVLTARMA